MTAAAQQQTIAPPAVRPVASQKKEAKYLTWKDFQRRYRNREDGNKYEWVNGKVEKTPRSMDQRQLFVWANLLEFLMRLKMKNAAIGNLSVETDTFLREFIHRKPDIAYFSTAQILAAAEGELQIPPFVIEVISPNDNANRVNRKVREYFDAGVQTVWHIFPELQEVHVYESATRMQICRGEALCSAERVIPGFAISTNDIFKK